MNKMLSYLAIAALATATGCKSVPSVDSMYATGASVGMAAGLVVNQTKIDDASRNAVIDIMNEVDSVIPATNSTFEAAWTPIAEAHVAKLVDAGKIDDGQAKLILGAFGVATKGLDYLFDVRYPKARQYQDLVEAGVHGFCSGFLSVFKPVNALCSGQIKYDEDAYEYLMSAK